MIKTGSEDIRRFFDLLGSIFLSVLAGLAFWQNSFYYQNKNYLFLPLFIILGLSLGLPVRFLIWRFVNTKLLLGYLNFLLISILSVSIFAAVLFIEDLIRTRNSNYLYFQIGQLLSSITAIKVVFFYAATSLPMAFFWLIGILTAWKFSKKDLLP